MAKYKIPRGTYDILPKDGYKWQFIRKKFKEIMKNYNYNEIVTPIFESAALFERSVGDTSDIVEKEMYKFKDKKGREFALRPEGTAPVVRSFVNNGLYMQGNHTKLFYDGPMFRYDRPQKGRYRQFYQFGIELIGTNEPYFDAEVISMGYRFLKCLGLSDFELQINSLGNPKRNNKYDEILKKYFEPFKDDLCDDCKRRLSKNPRRILDCKNMKCKEIAQNAPSLIDYLEPEAKEKFEKVSDYLDKLDVKYVINPKIVRGLDYYTDTAFEFITNKEKSQNAIIAGGRYNGLVKELGGKNVPGIGFAGGFERLILAMEKEGLSFGEKPKPEAFMVAMGNNAQNTAVKLLELLRSKGISAEYDISKTSFRSQLKAADKSGAKFAIIIGEDELKNNSFSLKNLESGKQKMFSKEELLEKIKTNIALG